MSTDQAADIRDSRIEGRCPDTGTTHTGIVIDMHTTDGDVTIWDEATGQQRRVQLRRLAPRYAPGDRVRLCHDPGSLGTIAAASSRTVAVNLDDGGGYHGTDSAVEHAA